MAEHDDLAHYMQATSKWKARALAAEARAEELEKGIGSLLWVVTNRHKRVDPRWDELAEAAERDARAALRPGETDA